MTTADYTRTLEPIIEMQKRLIAQRAYQLVEEAKRLGIVLTVEQVPLEPLAMGSYTTLVSVRAARKPA